jgi:hypothetical protein
MRWRGSWFLGLCFLALVVCVLWALGPDFVAAARSYTWKPTPCEILHSGVAEEPFSRTVTHFVLRVEYTYQFGGQQYRPTRFTTGERQGSTDIGKAERAAIRFAPGTRAICYVNPRNPKEAVLERGELWGGIFLFAPFLIIALIMHEQLFAWFERRRWRRRTIKNVPLSETNDALRADGRFILFGCIGLVMGTFFLGFCLIGPWWFWSQSRHWVQTTATITRCEISTHSTQHGPSYSLQLTYEYDFQGRRYRSDRKRFGLSINEPVVDLSKWVRAHPVGSSVVCFVNPADPTEAVLDRAPSIGWVPLAVGGLMLGFGIFLFAKLWRTRWMRLNLTGEKLTEYCLGEPSADTRRLRILPPPWLMAIACGLGALLLIPPAAWSLAKGMRALMHGQGDIINLLYGAAAAIGAVWLLRQCVKYSVHARQPAPVLRLTPGVPTVGEPLQVEWEFPTSKSFESLSISLEGAEEAKVRQITPGYHGAVSEEKTNRSVFSKRTLIEATSPQRFGSASIKLPVTTMHSFRGAKCGISWQIKVKIGLVSGKSAEYAFPVNVRPA